MTTKVSHTTRRLQPFGIKIDCLCCQRTSGSSCGRTYTILQRRGTSTMLITPGFQRRAVGLATCLRRTSVPCTFVSFGVRRARTLYCVKRSSGADKCVTTGVLVHDCRGKRRLILFLGGRGGGPTRVRVRHHLRKFVRCLSRRRGSLVVRSVILRGRSASNGEQVLSTFFGRRPRTMLKTIFGSHICRITGCLRRGKRGLTKLIKCSLLRGGARFLGANRMAFLVNRHPNLRNCYNIGALYGRIMFGEPIATIGCVPVSVLVGRGVSFCFRFRWSGGCVSAVWVVFWVGTLGGRATPGTRHPRHVVRFNRNGFLHTFIS